MDDDHHPNAPGEGQSLGGSPEMQVPMRVPDHVTETANRLGVRFIGGTTALLELGGLRMLTDPTFDPPRDYPLPNGRALRKLAGPAVDAGELEPVDLVLLSHDQHEDNLDESGRELLAKVPLVATTSEGASRLGGQSRALAPWDHIDVERPDGGPLHITGVPARHGPEGAESVMGPVTGFVLSGDRLPTVYISGDNASIDIVRDIARRVSPDVAILFAGGARPGILGGAYLTLTSELAAEATRILGAWDVVPLHVEGWAHFNEGPDVLREAFAAVGLSDRLHVLRSGESIALPQPR
jgi:L-ascorbate metabolism protein UlaG (beta-lactamase superfamily)